MTVAMGIYCCDSCGAALANDDIALNRRLCGDKAARFYCGPCLGRRMGCSPAEMDGLKRHFKSIGCELFERDYLAEGPGGDTA